MGYASKEKMAGWDDLYEDQFNTLNQLIDDNLNRKHNPDLIQPLFFSMLKALEKAQERMQDLGGNETLKQDWYEKAQRIKDYSNHAETLNKKVIVITMIDQFLRSTY